jgi:hypothetical protein
MRNAAIVLLACLVSAGCWQPRYFAPRENLNGSGPEGDAAAVYALPAAPGASSPGEVRVWCAGAKARYDGDDEVVELFVGFELENNGQEPVGIDPAQVVLEDLMVDGVLQPPLAPHSVMGSGQAVPGMSMRYDLVFRPEADAPSDISRFAVRFSVLAGERVVLSQRTPFGPARSRVRGYYAYPDDPWLYGRVGYGWGYGVWGPWGPYGPGWGPYGPFLCR